jgi:hypothetical protein
MRYLEENHIIDYFLLFFGLGVFLFLLYVFKYNTTLSLFISLGGSLFYMLWGIVHHALEKRLHREIVLEYILIGVFMFALLSVVIIY